MNIFKGIHRSVVHFHFTPFPPAILCPSVWFKACGHIRGWKRVGQEGNGQGGGRGEFAPPLGATAKIVRRQQSCKMCCCLGRGEWPAKHSRTFAAFASCSFSVRTVCCRRCCGSCRSTDAMGAQLANLRVGLPPLLPICSDHIQRPNFPLTAFNRPLIVVAGLKWSRREWDEATGTSA